ncbi:trna delta -isopentenylpyrophosphate transferase [Microvirga thermotolerans]|uniref:Trna delta-isopentenylpyrophosphate transferase n=1 Tax=Microvirga thermotolerans TaxID=2651334 RepID=A0A5P9JSD1_9HYPH|nr:trna delta -isopentenylpyrophosphate transferase [Microvirga thermotolerans]QFU15537.1 trna delta -isopentenylpyrophosphate transferase [Microvirga thermotolerans]
MNTTDKKIAEVLAKFGEPMAGNIWRVQGTAVIYHKALERIAAQAAIQFEPPTIIRAERDEAVILVTGRMGERVEWSIGEALVGTNYRVSGKQAAYVYAMAEKRAKDRVILKLIELHGLVYSEEEADEFKNSRPAPAEPQAASERTAVEIVGPEAGVEAELKGKISKAKSINAVTDLMLHADTQRILNDLPEGVRDEIRDFAKARLVELGWPSKKAA